MEYIQLISVLPLAFLIAIIMGFILIIIALLPFLAISFFKNLGLDLRRNQSMKLAALGSILVLIGLVGMAVIYSEIENARPIIYDVSITPDDIVAVENGTPVTVSLLNREPDLNFIQKLFFNSTPLVFEFAIIGPGTNYSAKRIKGPTTENTAEFLIYPSDAGENIFMINVTGGGLHDYYEHSIKLNIGANYNQPPIIEKIFLIPMRAHASSVIRIPLEYHPSLVNETIKIFVKAADPENDTIYYKFLRIPPYSDKALEIPPPVEGDFRDNTRHWKPEKRDIGENIIIVSVRDGNERSPYVDRNPVQSHRTINISDRGGIHDITF